MRKLTWLMAVALVLMLACGSGAVTVHPSRGTVRPPDPTITVVTPTVSLPAGGVQGTLKWDVAVPAPVVVSNTATATWTNPDLTTGTVTSAPVTITVAEPTVTNVTWFWNIPSNVIYVSGTVVNAAGVSTALATPVGTLLTAPCGTLAAGQVAHVTVIVKSK